MGADRVSGESIDDLIAFYKARLREDEAAAQESYYEGQRWLTEEEGVYRWPDDELVHTADRKADARHIARHDPARALREVAAKRARLERHHPEKDPAVIGLYGFLCAWCSSISVSAYQRWPCPDVLDDLAVWSDHPDFQQEWKP